MNRFIAKGVDWMLLTALVLPLSLWTYQRNDLWKNELELWRDSVKKSPQKERAHNNFGFAYYELGLLDEAKKEFEEALRLNPRFANAIYNLGLVYQRKGLTDDAIDYYKKAVRLDSKIPGAFYNLGLAYSQKHLYEEAIEAYKRFLEIKPDYKNAHNNLGLAYGGLKQWDKAVWSFQKELRYHPDNFYAHVYLGSLYYMELKDDPKALFHLQKALEHPQLPHREAIQKMVSTLKDRKREKKEETVDAKD
jgi:tetratricopeptide (TPR) repeat protein